MKKSASIPYDVTPEDVDQYWKNGYWISPKLISDDRIAELRQAIDDLFKGKRDGIGGYFEPKISTPADQLALRRVVNAWWVNDLVRDMVLDRQLGQICARLMKVDKARLWSDQVIVKPAAASREATSAGNVGWHQDYAYWRIPSTTNMITAWIALQDTDLENGGMRTLLGSHEWGLIEDSDTFFETNLDALRDRFSKETGKEWVDEPCLLKAGQVSFHHSLCFHGSGENKSSADRYSVVGHYMPDGTRFQPCGRITTQLRMLGPRPKAGQELGGEMFPLTY